MSDKHIPYTIRGWFSSLLRMLVRNENKYWKVFKKINKDYISHYNTPYIFQFTSEKQDTMNLVVLPFDWYDDYEEWTFIGTWTWYNIYELVLDGDVFIRNNWLYEMKLVVKTKRSDDLKELIPEILDWRDELIYVWVVDNIKIDNIDADTWYAEIEFDY